jgi:arginyl-tRNA synthetase
MIEKKIAAGIAEALKNSFEIEANPESITLENTNKQYAGDFTFVVFPYLKQTKRLPEETARIIGEYLKQELAEISNFNIVKGFLNIELSNEFWIKFLQDALNNPDLGRTDEGKGQSVMVEFSSPNTNKPQHLGHVRNNLLGFSVSRILENSQYKVIKANLINDRGIHICKSMLAWQKFAKGETPESSGTKGDHFVGKYYVMSDKIYREQIKELVEQGFDEAEAKKQAPFLLEAQEMLKKWEDGDPELKALWEMMNGWVYSGFNKTYERMGISFDRFYYESQTYLLGKKLVEEGLEKGVFFKKFNGSIWVDLTPDGLDEKLLLRADGTSVYITQDIGTAQLKFDDCKMDRSIYVVGNEQDYHFKVLKLILAKLGKPFAKGIFHLSYGMVDLPGGKMKTREGTVVDADELMDEMFETAKQRTIELGKTEGMDEAQLEKLYETVGMGALKYFLLKVDPTKRMLFNPQESIDFQGNTGPFIQYTYTRIRSIMRANVGNQNRPIEQGTGSFVEAEKELLSTLHRFSQKAAESAQTLSPALIATYVYDLAKSYNRFYHELTILGEKDQLKRQLRLQLSELTGSVIKRGMYLLGIDVPERM